MASKQSIARKLGWLLACLFIAGAGCEDDSAADGGHSHEEGGGHSHGDGAAGEHGHDNQIGDLTGGECPDDSTLGYDNFGKKFIADYCLSCHSVDAKRDAANKAPADHNFDELIDIETFAAHIDQYAGSGPKATNTKMPPSDPKPTMEEREKLTQWLTCGAPK